MLLPSAIDDIARYRRTISRDIVGGDLDQSMVRPARSPCDWGQGFVLKPQGFAVVGFAYGFTGFAYGSEVSQSRETSTAAAAATDVLPPTAILLPEKTTTGHWKAHRPT